MMRLIKGSEMRMKKTIALVLAMILFAGMFAVSEEKPDGSVGTVYKAVYDKEALSGFERTVYYEPSGLLLSAYSDDMEITVSIENAESQEAFSSHYLESVSKYAKVISVKDTGEWTTPLEIAGDKMRLTYMYLNASETDDVYVSDVFYAYLDDGLCLSVVFTTWVGEAGKTLDENESAFFSSFSLHKTDVSAPCIAQVKSAKTDSNGDVYLTLDFCTVEYDESIFSIYAVNETEEEILYKIKKDALVFAPKPDTYLYSMNEIQPSEEIFSQVLQKYLEKYAFDIIFRVLFDANNEIVWMMHYNAF